jgi:hypothetical protein
LIGRVQEGAIRVPDFQRPLRWGADDVVKLFDSILKGYPVGSLLFWKRHFAASEIRVGSARIQVPATDDGWFVVDGQQRMTALAASLLDLPQHGDTRWDVVFDPRTSSFIHQPGAGAGDTRCVPLRALGDLRRLGRWFRECELSEDEQTRVEAVQQRLLDYEIPVYITETEDVDALRGVFARMNSTGVRMRADEVFQALLGSRGGSKTRRTGVDLDLLQRAADVDGFGQPPRTEILKALLAMSGLDPSKRLDDLGDEAVGRLVGSDDAAEALARTAAFLQAPVEANEPGCGIPAYAFIPYPVAFVLLARWFHLFPEPDAATRRALGQWLWRGVATGVHQRAAVSAMRLQVREIREGEMARSLESLLDAVGDPGSREWSLDPFHAAHAASRVEMIALLSRAPRDRMGPISWRALLSSGGRVAREVFTIAELEGELRKLARTAANRVLLDSRPTHLVTELRSWSWARDRQALESHLIDEAGLHALQTNDRNAFFVQRGARIRALVSSLVSRRAGIGQPRILPVAAYYDAPEDPAA